MYRAFLHRFARVTYCWSVRWKMDPLFINNKEAFQSIKLYDQDSNLIEFDPKLRQRYLNQQSWRCTFHKWAPLQKSITPKQSSIPSNKSEKTILRSL